MRSGGRLRELGRRLDAELRRLRRGGSGGGGDGDGRKKTKGAINASPWRSIYKGPTGSAHCGSFHYTTLTLTALCP
jgi:hypothetical protein